MRGEILFALLLALLGILGLCWTAYLVAGIPAAIGLASLVLLAVGLAILAGDDQR